MTTLTESATGKKRTLKTRGESLNDAGLVEGQMAQSALQSDSVTCRAFLRKIAEIQRKLSNRQQAGTNPSLSKSFTV